MPSSSRILLRIAATLFVVVAPKSARAQGMPNPRDMEEQVQRIARERPVEAELAARAFVARVTPREVNRLGDDGYFITFGNRIFIGPWTESYLRTLSSGPDSTNGTLRYLDRLKATSLDAYWQEIAQLAVQGEMAKQVGTRDSVRGQAMEQMFGIELQARRLQRAYPTLRPESAQANIRSALEQLMSRHFDIETRLMELEVADATRRLDAVRGQLAMRPEARGKWVQQSVNGILQDPRALDRSPGSTPQWYLRPRGDTTTGGP
jgi:hypothetical protein